MANYRLAILGLETFLTTPTLHGPLAATSSLDHECRIPTTQRAGGHYLSVECGNRRFRSRERVLEQYARRGRLWPRQLYPHDDQSVFPPGFLLIDCRLKWTQDEMSNQVDYVELGMACANVCTALDRGLSGKKLSDLNNSVREAINQLKT